MAEKSTGFVLWTIYLVLCGFGYAGYVFYLAATGAYEIVELEKIEMTRQQNLEGSTVMARNMNRETLEQKIAKTERAISRNREQNDRLTAELEDLHKKKKAILNEEILKAIAGSEKSYEEILSFIQGKTDTDSREEE